MLKCHLKGKTCSKLANGQDFDYSEKKKKWQMDRILIILNKKGHRASSAPLLGLFSIIFKHLLVYTADLR